MNEAAHTLTLIDGLTIGEAVHLMVAFRVPRAKEIMAAAREAEVLVHGADGRPALATSPTRLTYLLLGAQIERIGDYPGPFGLAVLGKLSARDLESLQVAASMIEQAEGVSLDRLVGEAQARGRPDRAGGHP